MTRIDCHRSQALTADVILVTVMLSFTLLRVYLVELLQLHLCLWTPLGASIPRPTWNNSNSNTKTYNTRMWSKNRI